MQNGGVGKTQLAVAFAERAEKNSWTLGGSFWIRASGTESKLIANLAEGSIVSGQRPRRCRHCIVDLPN